MMKTILLLPTLIVLFSLEVNAGFNFPLTYSDPALLEKSNSHTASKDCELVIEPPGFGVRKVVIDAGHGGRDGGCSGKNSVEKKIALSIALKLGKEITTNFPDVEVIYTRDKDVFIPLYQRAEIANKNDADLFISIHCNFIPNASFIKGSETYVMGLHTADHNLNVAKRENEAIYLEEGYKKNYGVDPNSPEGHIILSAYQNVYLEQSILFAEKVESQIGNTTSHHSRGVKQAGFVVLKETTMPSVLIETGYLSNHHDEKYLLTEEGQSEVAKAILGAFREYKKLMDTGDGLIAATNTAAPAKPNQAKEVVLASTPVQTSDEPRAEALAIKIPPKSGSLSNVNPPNSSIPEKKPSDEPETSSSVVQFRVQIAASKNLLKEGETNWQDIGYKVEVTKEGVFYKYQVKGFRTLDQASKVKDSLKSKGFKDAFIVAYRSGQKISVAEANSLVTD